MTLENARAWGEIIQSAVTVIAVVIAGIWTYTLFIKGRQKYPRARLTQAIVHKPLPDGRWWIRVDAGIENVGNVLLSIVHAETTIQQILPILPDLVGENAVLPICSESPGEIDWPNVETKPCEWKPGDFEVEPGESELVHWDFIVDSGLRTVQIYTFIRNQRKKDRPIGWCATSVIDLEESPRSEAAGGLK